MSETARQFGDGAAWSQGATAMESNRYTLAGWFAIATAALFPAALLLSFAQGIIGIKAFHYRGPHFGPSDLIFLIVTVLVVYTLLRFKNLLNERYDHHGCDVILPVIIWFGVFWTICSLMLTGFILAVWPVSHEVLTVVSLAFMAFFMISAGILDIVLAVTLLKAKGTLNTKIDIFAYVVMAKGIAELTVVLAPAVGFLLLPASYVVLGVIFLQDREEVEFV